MPNDFDIVSPNKGQIKFSGGLNNKFDKQLIGANESPELFNVILGSDSVETRGGTSKLNTTAAGSFSGDGLFTRSDNVGNQTMCAWWNGTLYALTGTSTFTTVPSAQSIFTAGVRVAATEYENYMFFGNGTTAYKYNGDFTRHGIPAATIPSTNTAPTGTGLTGAYQYKVTYVNSGLVESDVSTASATHALTNENMRVSIPVAPMSFGVGTRRLYRTEAGGTTFKRVATISDNVTATYDDAVADGSLGVTAPTDQGEPPNYSVLVSHQNRIFCNDTAALNLIWYSELADPYIFKATSFIRVGDNSGDIVRGLQVYDNSILVFCDNSQWLIYITDPATPSSWQQVRIKSNFGSNNHFGSFAYRNKIMFPAMQSNKIVGFAAVSGTTVENSATLLTTSAVGSELKSTPIEPDIFLIEEGRSSHITSFVFQNRAYISVPYGIGSTKNNRIYVFDFSTADLMKKQEGSWVPWTGLNAVQFTEYAGKLYYQTSDATGFVYEMNTLAYNDDGAAIDSYFWSKEFSGQLGHETSFKDFRSIDLLYEKSGDYYMNFGYRVDSDSGVGTTEQVNLDPGGSLWGTAIFGSSTWGGGQIDGESQVTLSNVRGQRIQFKFSNQNVVNQKFSVKGLSFIYNIKNRRGRR